MIVGDSTGGGASVGAVVEIWTASVGVPAPPLQATSPTVIRIITMFNALHRVFMRLTSSLLIPPIHSFIDSYSTLQVQLCIHPSMDFTLTQLRSTHPPNPTPAATAQFML
jgi:hypothetical protein